MTRFQKWLLLGAIPSVGVVTFFLFNITGPFWVFVFFFGFLLWAIFFGMLIIHDDKDKLKILNQSQPLSHRLSITDKCLDASIVIVLSFVSVSASLCYALLIFMPSILIRIIQEQWMQEIKYNDL